MRTRTFLSSARPLADWISTKARHSRSRRSRSSCCNIRHVVSPMCRMSDSQHAVEPTTRPAEQIALRIKPSTSGRSGTSFEQETSFRRVAQGIAGWLTRLSPFSAPYALDAHFSPRMPLLISTRADDFGCMIGRYSIPFGRPPIVNAGIDRLGLTATCRVAVGVSTKAESTDGRSGQDNRPALVAGEQVPATAQKPGKSMAHRRLCDSGEEYSLAQTRNRDCRKTHGPPFHA